MIVSFITLGCKVNQYESSALKELFIKNGEEIKELSVKTEITVINSCAVTTESVRKCKQMMRRAKKIAPKSIICMIGCLPQIETENLNECDIIIGSDKKNDLLKHIHNFILNKKKIIAVENIKNIDKFENMESQNTEKVRALLKIQDGCENFCSYCIIPFTRGKLRSLDINEAVNQAQYFVKNNYKEIVLTGIHLDNYGKEHKKFDLCDLLEKIDEINGIERISLGSLEPTFINEKNMERLVKLKHLCSHFHLSLQSGCDNVLKRMNRQYTTTEYLKIIELLRKNFEDMSVTTDIIVGFPGETTDEFDETLEFIRKIGFTKIHVFPYSRRIGTKADLMDGQINNEIKNKRVKILMDLSDQYEKSFLEKNLGKRVEVLFETKNNGFWEGYTKNYLSVLSKSEQDLENKITEVIIQKIDKSIMYGDIAF